MPLPHRRSTSMVAAAALSLGVLAVVVAAPASAATTLTVSTTADTATNAGACGNSAITTVPSPLSLREATCLSANIGGTVTINVPGGRYALDNGELRLGGSGNNVTIAGAGSGSTVLDGQNANRVLNIDEDFAGGVSTTLSNLTLTNGWDATFGGGAIIAGSDSNATPDSLTLNSVVVSNSTAVGQYQPGGGVQMYGGRLAIVNSTFTQNQSNTSGSAVFYQSVNGPSTDAMTITGSTFVYNAVSNSGSSGTSGGALAVQGVPGSTYTVANSRFTNNTASGPSAQPGTGGAIYQPSGSLTVLESTFTGNAIAGSSSVGAAVYSAGTATLRYNRIVGNSGVPAVYQSSGSTNATDNWWGCNAGPNNSGCDTVGGSGGSITVSPRLVLTASASPSTVVGPGASSIVTASLRTNSVGTDVGASNLDAFAALPVTFNDPAGDATVTTSPGSHTSPIGSGTASIDYHSGTVAGPNPVNASFDNATTTAALTVNRAPAVTSANATAFRTGQAGSFTITTTGYPAAAITSTGTVPTGLTFTDNGNGTATLAGTPTGAGGTFPLTIVATNGVSPNASQSLVVTVGQAPAFTSPATATFRTGQAGSFTVTTSGEPTVTAITRSGTLPAGVSFVDNGDGTATIAGTPTGAGGTYPLTLSATNGTSPDASQAFTLQVDQAPAVTGNPADQTVQPGTTVSFSAAASGVPTPAVRWQVSTDGGTTFTNIAGATSTTYTLTSSSGQDGNLYRAVFTNAAGSATSTAATLRVGSAPAFTSSNQTSFRVGAAGTYAITTAGMPSATLSRTGAQFPAWLTLTDNGDGTGMLTGTPPAGSGGQYQFTLKAANGFSPSASQVFTLSVDQSPVITSPDRATFQVGSAGRLAVTTTAGYPTTTTLTRTGPLPSGVSFVDNGDGTASLAGTPAAGTGGEWTFTVTASAAGGSAPAATQTVTLTVREAPRITSADHATFASGSAGSFTVTTNPGSPAAVTLTTSGSLPAGVSFTDNGDGTATISGSPTAGTGGVYSLVLTASNGVPPDSSQNFTLTVEEPPTITSSDHVTFTQGVASAFTVTSAGGQPSSTTLTGTGPLPAGVTFTDNGDGTATIAGTPTNVGTYPVTVRADNGVLPAARQDLVLTVNGPPAITSADHTTFTVGAPGSFTVTTSPGLPAARTITVSGAVPAGVTFTDNGDGTATIAGTPAAGSGGQHPLTLRASNGVGPDAVQSFTLTVEKASSITSADRATFTVGSASSFTLTTSEGFPPGRSLTVTGALPSGISFTDEGDGTATLAGTPAPGAAGAYELEVAVDSAAGGDRQAFVLTVVTAAQTITRTTAVPTPAVVGASWTPTATATSGLPVTIALDQGATTNAACRLDDGTVVLERAGHCRVVYTQPGDGTWSPAPAESDDLDVRAIGSVVTVTPQAVAVHGQQVVVTAVVSGEDTVPAGAVQFAVAGRDVGRPVAVDAAGRASSPALLAADATPLVPGAYVVTASFVPTDPTQHAPSSGSTTQVVDRAATTTDLTVLPGRLRAVVAPVAPGAGEPRGQVTFYVAGEPVGTADLSGGTATLDHVVPVGATRQVAATYAGESRFTGSSDSLARHDPTITATVSSRTDRTRSGWYRTPVRVTFRCTAAGAALAEACPAPVVLDRNGAAQAVSRTVHATDGGAATATVSGIDIDRAGPKARVTGVRDGAVYHGTAPEAGCRARDGLSGVARCVVRLGDGRGNRTTYRVVATDRAGNTTTVTGSYRTSPIELQGASFRRGAWNVVPGHTYTLVVHSTSQPRYYFASPVPRRPGPQGVALHPAGRGRWALAVTMDRAMRAHALWNLGVRIDSTLHRVRVRTR